MLYDGEKVVNAFKENYAKFIEKFHTYYPNAKIVVMQTLNSNPVNATEAAKFATRDAVFTAMNEEGYFDADYVYYMPTDDIELKYYDNLHPDEEDPDGHPKLTEYVIDFLKDNKIIK